MTNQETALESIKQALILFTKTNENDPIYKTFSKNELASINTSDLKNVHVKKVITLKGEIKDALPYTLQCIIIKQTYNDYNENLYSYCDQYSDNLETSTNSIEPTLNTFKFTTIYNQDEKRHYVTCEYNNSRIIFENTQVLDE